MPLAPPTRSPRGWAPRWLDSPPPRIAVEVGAGAVAAARARSERGGLRLAASAVVPFAAEAVTPAPAAANIADPEALREALRQALERVGGLGRDAVLLLPDAAARVMLLDFEEIPRHTAELAALVRFRLRKTLPFDADAAVLSAEVLEAGRERTVVAVIAERGRVEEYGAALEGAGGRAARIVPAGLAALMAAPELGHATLLLRQEGQALTAAFAWNQLPRLFRVLPAAPAVAYEDVYPSAAYFRDFWESHANGSARESRPVIAAFGLAPGLLERLRGDCEWADVAAAPAWAGGLLASAPEPQSAERLVALAGALADGSA